jgi:tetratricopeptide (TPR) repeat protein
MPIVQVPRGTRVLSAFLIAFVLLLGSGYARAQSDEAIDKVTKMNKKAVEEYENLNFEEARKILKEALDYCSQNGLDKHPIKARTHIHLGVVILAGFKQREVAIKQFRKALELQPDIKLTKSLANPEIQEAFDEAAAGAGSPEKAEAGDKGEKAEKGGKAEKGEKAAAGGNEALAHDPVSEGTQGSAITITARLDAAVASKKVVLAYRPDGASDFLGRVMKEVSPGTYSAEIPASATTGNRVAYYIEAQGADENALAAKGTADDPLVIALKGAGAPEVRKSGKGEEGDDDEEGPKWFLGLGVGSGFGWTTGNAEFDNATATQAGFKPATLGHLSPEVGYFLRDNLLLSVQLRLQLVTGLPDFRLTDTPENHNQCGGDLKCSPATNAVSAFAKLTYLFGEESFHPYLSLAVGGGQIRHVANFPDVKSCGPNANSTDACSSSVVAGPIFVGPGVGFMFNASDNFAFTLGVNTQLGFPKFTFNLDLNAGVAVEF